MRFQLGMPLWLLAGCVVQPTATDPTLAPSGPAARAFPLPSAPPPCIGVEFLPPEAASSPLAAPAAAPRVEAVPLPAAAPAPDRAARSRSGRRERHTWTMDASDLAAIDDPIERETLQFVDDLVREDRRRVRHEVRLPFFDFQPADDAGAERLWSEESAAQWREQWIDEHGPALLQRPLRRLLRRLPIARDVEVGIEDFRSANVPLSQPYRDAHQADRHLGRLSLRLHVDDFTDPVEVFYGKSGVRIGTSQEAGKLAIDWRLGEHLTLELRSRTAYDTGDRSVRADLSFWASPTTSYHLAIGDDLDFLSTASAYSLFESPMDGSPGLLVYAVHVF